MKKYRSKCGGEEMSQSEALLGRKWNLVLPVS